MGRRTLRTRALRFVSVVAIGGSAFQLSGCDPNVRSVLLGGLATTTNSLADALIAAFFASIDDSGSGSSSLTTT